MPANWRHGRLASPVTAEPGGRPPRWAAGLHRPDHGTGLLYVPARAPERLVILLHGAGGSAQHGIDLLGDDADEHRLMLYAPQSTGPTWDLLLDGYGPDVAGIAEALAELVPSYRPSTLAIGGFSDGASYALSLGLTNGDLFSTIVAFSPGFMAPRARTGTPRVFISHGHADRVLPIDRCGRQVATSLRAAGYPVEYHEFEGGHLVPQDARAAALRMLAGG
jgi:predicted esterase